MAKVKPQTVVVNARSISRLEQLLSKEKKNVIIVPSLDKGFVSNFLTNIGDQKYQDFDIEVYGQEKWLKFDEIDITYKHRTNLHVVASNLIDYNDRQTIDFMKAYRGNYHIDPTKFGFMGFDIAFNYMITLSTFGNSFIYNLGKLKTEGVHTRFELVKTDIYSGYENSHYRILKYENFELVQKDIAKKGLFKR